MRLGNSSLFTFAVQGSNDEFRVVDFEGKERVSAPFYFVVTLATTNFELETSALIDKSACLTLFAEKEAPRYIHGCIESVMMMDVGRRFATYQLVLIPKLHRLAHRSQKKIFQQQDAQQMMRTILIDAGLIEGDDFRFEVTGTLAQRTYTAQYAESDLDFFNRILAEDGLHYHFQFSADRHVLLISDTQYVFQRLTETPEIPFVAHSGLLKRDYVIHDFSLRTKLQPNKVTLKDYNFTKPSLNLETSEQTGSGDFEVYHHGGLYQEPDLGQQQVQTLLKAFQATSECGHGESNCVYLSAGKLFKLTDHNNPVFNQEYLLLEVQHSGAQPQSLEEGASNGPSGYMSQFICIPKTTEFKAKPPKPKVNKRNRFDGVQNATVVGPKGEEIYTDQYGRIKVQFNWDKDGQADEKSSRWIRVTQPWTGSSWGALQIPRIGQEILVSFVNGDPDRPLIKGVMYNGRNKPPYKLPDNKTRTTVKTCSTPGGQGFNELRFEDKKTKEQIFIHGERDQDIKIENDKDLRVYQDRHLVVDKQHHIHIKQLLSESINGTWKEDLWNSQYITVKQNFTEKAAKNYNREAGKEIHIKSTGKMVFDAGMQLSVSGSGSYFTLDPSGVKINGPTVRINAGGSPGRGATASPKNPVTADNAENKALSPALKNFLAKNAVAPKSAKAPALAKQIAPSTKPSDPEDVLITSVQGPDEVFVGKIYQFSVGSYEGTPTEQQKSQVSWRIDLVRKRVQTTTVKTLIGHGEILNLKIEDEWAFSDLRVMAYFKRPVIPVSKEPKLKGAWEVSNQWDQSWIKRYREYAHNKSDVYFRSDKRFTCEDFATTIILEFARKNKLPFKIKNGTGSYDAKTYYYGEHSTAERHETFERLVLRTTGAPDLKPGTGNTTEVANKSNYIQQAMLGKIQVGNIHCLSRENGAAVTHIQLVTDIKRSSKITKITITQGNFPHDDDITWLYKVGRVTGSNPNFPDSWNYYGVKPQRAELLLPSNKYLRSGSTEHNFIKRYVLYVTEWDFISWNA
ncbi:type VI secretion system Vgr family protein [Zooshikella harenae]|uniref:Type VI secretion system tip protein VgrG n=1 Tax=Zooshikella harenae TaxID=2827238 RepID=A0ABS5ZKV4_9GAMM|nr:type VI secretion system tip protein TssI/VgrG [Zooshikella harenae]MBU2713940.1 type VI secretion system tip protein VgrG [Zooshikella harenae]